MAFILYHIYENEASLKSLCFVAHYPVNQRGYLFKEVIAHLLIILKWPYVPLYRKAYSFQVSFKDKDSRGLLKETTNGVLTLS